MIKIRHGSCLLVSLSGRGHVFRRVIVGSGDPAFCHWLRFRGCTLFGLVGPFGDKPPLQDIVWNEKFFSCPNAGQRSVIEPGIKGIRCEKTGMPSEPFGSGHPFYKLHSNTSCSPIETYFFIVYHIIQFDNLHTKCNWFSVYVPAFPILLA
jgi:hypothetical protein